jgi:glutamine synthetase
MNDTDTRTSPVRRYLHAHPATETIEVVLTDLNGIYRGKWLPADGIDKVLEGKFKMPLTSVACDIWGRDVPALCRQTGDGDGICTAIEETISPLPWLPRPTAQLFLQLNTETGIPWEFDPRVVRTMVAARFNDISLTPVCAPELGSTCSARRDEGGLRSFRPAGSRRMPHGGQLYGTESCEQADLMYEIRQCCDQMEIPQDRLLENWRRQYEIVAPRRRSAGGRGQRLL